MAKDKPRNMPASIRQRLLNYGVAAKLDPNLTLLWYAFERLLYRLSVSPYGDRFVVKGAMLFRVWGGAEFRATKDLDLLGFVRLEIESLKEAFTVVCNQPVEDDGLIFDPAAMRISEIRIKEEYGGLRVLLNARLGTALIPLQIDVGFGDAITPAATHEEFPSMLGQPRARIRAYPRETVIAEKYQAVVERGMTNTRIKDYYDIWYLSRHFPFHGSVLASAIRATFKRRDMTVPEELPIGLKPAYAKDTAHQRQWRAFISRIGADSRLEFEEVLEAIAAFILAPSRAAATGATIASKWRDGVWRG